MRRQVLVTLDDNLEHYQFTGPWSGKDVTRVGNHLFKKYREYARFQRLTGDKKAIPEKLRIDERFIITEKAKEQILTKETDDARTNTSEHRRAG